MVRVLYMMLFSVLFLYGYVDSDLDGVDDSVDKCPNTPFSDLVDESGCTIKSLIEEKKSARETRSKSVFNRSKIKKRKKEEKLKRTPHPILQGSNKKSRDTHYDISVGYNKIGGKSNESVMANIYHKNLSLSLFTAIDNKRNYDDSRLSDTRVWGYYSYRYNKNLLLKMGAGIVVPHIDSNGEKRVDAGLSLFGSYTINEFNPYFGASYRFTGLKGDEYGLKDYYSIYGGAGFYLSQKLYMSYTFSYSSAEYNWAEDIKTDSLYLYYNLDDNWFGTASYLRNIDGLDYDDGFSFSIGYYF